MSKHQRKSSSSPDDLFLPPKRRKPVPHEFVLEALVPASPYTRPMFGCMAIYVRDKIVLILRHKPTYPEDNGVWLATTPDHHETLRREFPNMRSIKLLKKKVTGWQVLPANSPDFESSALHACELVLAGDPRIGKVPGARKAAALRVRKPGSRKRASRKRSPSRG